MSAAVAALRQFLDLAGPGEVADRGQLDDLLPWAWPDLDGSGETAMESWKLYRIEGPRWAPPVLSFEIERHGATVNGSTRAEVQAWAVDLDKRTAHITGSHRRQLYPAASRLDVGPIADEVVRLVQAGADDPRLRWPADRSTVRVLASRAVPADGYKQTVEARRRRFRDAVNARLAAAGWVQTPAGWAPGEGSRP